MKKVVESSATMLDEVDPGWHRQIDLETLDMSNACNCILGQLYVTFGRGKARLAIEIGRDYGFALNAGDLRFNPRLAWQELKALWVEAIELRLLNDELEASTGIGVKTEEELAIA